jgi:hypothetical protein
MTAVQHGGVVGEIAERVEISRTHAQRRSDFLVALLAWLPRRGVQTFGDLQHIVERVQAPFRVGRVARPVIEHVSQIGITTGAPCAIGTTL